MAIDNTSIRHCIEDINRRIAEEYLHLHLVIIPYSHEKSENDIETACAPFAAHPEISTIKTALTNTLQPQSAPSLLVGIAQGKEKSLIPFLAKTRTIAGIWLNTAGMSQTREAEIEIYRQLWGILKLEKDIKEKRTSTYKLRGALLTPKSSGLEKARDNMLADSFAAALIALTGNRDIIRGLAETRCHMSFDRKAVFSAAQYPYPIALDAAFLVFEDLRNLTDPPIALALKIAEEIGLTCDDNIISQWQAFINPAQDMLLSGIDIKNIMGAAIYTSEDAYNRSIAYLVCDILGTQPAPTTNFDGYNPFADTDAQERAHNKARDAYFEDISAEEGGLTFDTCMKAAHAGCWNLLNGNPVGWSAPAWIAAAHAIKTGNEAPETAFQATSKDLDWLHIRTLHRGLLYHRRQGNFPTLTTITELLRQEDDLRDMALGIKELIDMFETH